MARNELSRLTLTGEGRAATPEGLRQSLDFLLDQINRNFQSLADKPETMLAVVDVTAGAFALGTGTALQNAFPSAQDVWTFAANRAYLVEGLYAIAKSGTTCTVGIGFAQGGGISLNQLMIFACGFAGAANTAVAAQGTALVGTSSVVTATDTGNVTIWFRGILMVSGAGGTITPQIIFSAAPTSPQMAIGSFITFTPIGANTVVSSGSVA